MNKSTDKKTETTEKKSPNINHPKYIIASFELGQFVWFMMNQGFRMRTLNYYQGVLHLDPTLFLLAFLIFTIYNMFNDPLIGHLSDKSTRFVKKWGKRFPFILMGAIPFCFVPIFLFSSPVVDSITNPQFINQIAIFTWLILWMFVFDGLFSLWDVNRIALFPKKFKTNDERTLAGLYEAIMDTIGIAMGFLIPIFVFAVFRKTLFGYTLQAVIMSIISFILILLMIPGIREPDELRERQIKIDQWEKSKFFGGMKIALKDRNFLGYVILFTCYSITMGMVMSGIPWFVSDILGLGALGEIAFLGYVIAVPITAPLWYRLAKKIGIRKVTFLGAVFLAVSALVLLFVPSGMVGFVFTTIVAVMTGLVDGALESMVMPIFSSIVDQQTIKYKKREEGLYRGIVVFFQRLSFFIGFLLLWIIQVYFGYTHVETPGWLLDVPSFFRDFIKPYAVPVNAPFALLGFRFYMSLFPLIIMSIGAVSFWLLYRITPEKLQENIATLEGMGL
jgi:GPH family glycoside/pentoside/hexuronide:cation symporter